MATKQELKELLIEATEYIGNRREWRVEAFLQRLEEACNENLRKMKLPSSVESAIIANAQP